MAYRASSKRSTKTQKKTKPTESAQSETDSTKQTAEVMVADGQNEGEIFSAETEIRPPQPSDPGDMVSVDDLVGAPVAPVRDQRPQPQPQSQPPPQPQTQSQSQDSAYSDQYNRPPQQYGGRQRGFDRGHRFQRGFSHDRFGGNRNHYQHQNRSRPQNPVPRPTYTQDIDVPTETVRGILDTMPEGHGFLRPAFRVSERDVYISVSQIRRFLLRNGDMVEGQARPPKENERYWGLLKVEKINGIEAELMGTRPRFEDLIPVYPNKQLSLQMGATPISNRIIDLMAPIGFGQRGLIVSPPKAGKTTILKEIAAGVAANFPDVHLMAALIGERPEEVTDLSRSIKGEVLASNFDESPSQQVRIAEVALDRAKRLVEMGYDVVVLLDSITRLARAYNLVVNPSGRTLSGGFDPAALYPAKKFLGAARCVEPPNEPDPKDATPVPDEKAAEPQMEAASVTEDQSSDAEIPVAPAVYKRRVSPYGTGGSLTVIGTALVETGSRMDDLIYEEFKGTGNMELHLSRSLQERRIFPAIDVTKSGTRHDELLLGEKAMKHVTTLRHMISLLNPEEATMTLTERLKKTESNSEFLESLSQGG